MSRDTLIGLLATVLVWITGGFGFPLIRWLGVFTVGQLMVSRGLMTLSVPLFQRRGDTLLMATRRPMQIGAAWLAVCATAVFVAIRVWGSNPTVVVTATCPIFNFAIAWWKKGRKPKPLALLCLAAVVLGIWVATPWGKFWSLLGFGLSILGALAGALFAAALDDLNPEDKKDPMPAVFWQGVFMLIAGAGISIIETAGLIESSGGSWKMLLTSPPLIGQLLGFGFVLGTLNLLGNTLGIGKLKPEIQTTLVQVETVCAMIVSSLILKLPGEIVTTQTWIGVVITLTGAAGLTIWLQKEDLKNTGTKP